MLTFLSNVIGTATRHERWSAPHHWREGPRKKSGWEIERDLAEAKAKDIRRPGLY